MSRVQQPTRGVRNHNPGNIRLSRDPWQGLSGAQTDTAFFVFTSPAYGIRALAKTLITYQDKHGLRTIEDIIARWAPSNENNTAAYVAAVQRQFKLNVPGYRIGATIDVHRYQHARVLVEAIIHHENAGYRYDPRIIDKGLLMAGIEPPPKALRQSREVKGGAVAGTATALAAASDLVYQAQPALPILRSIAERAPLVLGIVALAAIGYMVWCRLDDSRRGLR